MEPSVKREVSGKDENALHLISLVCPAWKGDQAPHTFSFSPGPQRRPAARRSTTGPLSRSKLHTTISLTHLPILRATSSPTNGGGLPSPGFLDHPNRLLGVRVVADAGPLEGGDPEISMDESRTFSDLDREIEPEDEVRRFGILGVGVVFSVGTTEEGRHLLGPASGVNGSSSPRESERSDDDRLRFARVLAHRFIPNKR